VAVTRDSDEYALREACSEHSGRADTQACETESATFGKPGGEWWRSLSLCGPPRQARMRDRAHHVLQPNSARTPLHGATLTLTPMAPNTMHRLDRPRSGRVSDTAGRPAEVKRHRAASTSFPRGRPDSPPLQRQQRVTPGRRAPDGSLHAHWVAWLTVVDADR